MLTRMNSVTERRTVYMELLERFSEIQLFIWDCRDNSNFNNYYCINSIEEIMVVVFFMVRLLVLFRLNEQSLP